MRVYVLISHYYVKIKCWPCIVFKPLYNLWPILAVVTALLAVDWFLLICLPPIYSGELSNYAAYKPASGRPQIIILGSSRGRDGVPVDLLQREIDIAGLPHQAHNLSIGGGGTPSMLLTALEKYANLLRDLPEGSKVIYVFSLFELNFLQKDFMLTFANGAEMLADHGLIRTDRWSWQLRNISGFARLVYGQYWKELPEIPRAVYGRSIRPFNLNEKNFECNGAGLSDYAIIPINSNAMEKIAEVLGKKLILVSPPVSVKQIWEDDHAGINQLGKPFVIQLAKKYAVTYYPEFGTELNLPEIAFEHNCDHLERVEDKQKFTRKIVELVASEFR